MFRLLPEIVEPDTWTLAFHRTSPHGWVRWLACGKYKHVSAFTFVPALGLWLVYEIGLSGTRIVLLPASDAAQQRVSAMTADADLLSVRRQNPRKILPGLLPFSCVSAVKHLIGIRSGALRPDRLYRDCRAQGAQPVHGSKQSADQPGDARAAAAGA